MLAASCGAKPLFKTFGAMNSIGPCADLTSPELQQM
jgi:hypothetical protein